MALQDVDVLDIQSLQAILNRREDVLEQFSLQLHRSASKRQAYLAGEPMPVDITEIVRSPHEGRAGIVPNGEEYLLSP